MAQVTYAGVKSKTPYPLAPLPRAGEGKVSELSDGEKAVIAERVRQVKEHIPEAFEFMKALYAEGLVDGMRCLASVTVFDEVDHGAG